MCDFYSVVGNLYRFLLTYFIINSFFLTLAISPSSSCYSETVNTLRFGQRAKHIINEPLINEDPTIRIIRELREEIAYLKSLLQNHNNVSIKKICGVVGQQVGTKFLRLM